MFTIVARTRSSTKAEVPRATASGSWPASRRTASISSSLSGPLTFSRTSPRAATKSRSVLTDRCLLMVSPPWPRSGRDVLIYCRYLPPRHPGVEPIGGANMLVNASLYCACATSTRAFNRSRIESATGFMFVLKSAEYLIHMFQVSCQSFIGGWYWFIICSTK